jgi:hypothetical protein
MAIKYAILVKEEKVHKITVLAENEEEAKKIANNYTLDNYEIAEGSENTYIYEVNELNSGPIKITSVNQLIRLCEEAESPIDCFIGNGLIKSSKSVLFDDGKFSIINEIDGSEDVLTPEELLKVNIGKAIQNSCFYLY